MQLRNLRHQSSYQVMKLSSISEEDDFMDDPADSITLSVFQSLHLENVFKAEFLEEAETINMHQLNFGKQTLPAAMEYLGDLLAVYSRMVAKEDQSSWQEWLTRERHLPIKIRL